MGGIAIRFCIMRNILWVCRGVFQGVLVLVLLWLEGRHPSCSFSFSLLRWHEEIIKIRKVVQVTSVEESSWGGEGKW